MKVIIIKECKQGKINEVVEVADGFAKNFLIKEGFALPINHSTKNMLNKNLDKISRKEETELEEAKVLKALIENTTLEFSLKETNNVVHGSVTNKQILKALKEKNIQISKYSLAHVQIETLGITTLKIQLHKQVEAKLTIKVVKND